MTGSADASVTLIPIVSVVAGTVAIILCLLAIGTFRRALRRLTAQIREMRRHPRVGNLAPEAEPSLRPLTAELNHFLASLRSQIQEASSRGATLRSLTDGPPDVALIGVDGEWQILTFSRGATNLTGWERDEVLERHVEILFGAGDWERILPKLARRSVRQAGIAEDVRMLRRDGSEFAAHLSAGPVEEGETGQVGLLLAIRDVSDEQRMEKRLRESEERYRRLVEGMKDGVFIVQEGRLAYANPALSQMLGVAPDEVLNSPFKEIIDTRDVMRVVEILQGAEQGKEASGELVCLIAPRNAPPIEARVGWASIDYHGGRAIIGTLVDLTERARLERTIAENEARLRATLDATGDGILVLGRRGAETEVRLVNPAFCDLFGFFPKHWIGMSREDLKKTLGSQFAEPGFMDAILSPVSEERDVREAGLEIKTPRRSFVDLVAGPVRSSGEADVGVILTVRDVTARLEGERQIRHSLEDLTKTKADLEVAYGELAEAQKALAHRNEQLESINAELKSLDEMKSNLLANVSHELHTPLVSIKGYTEMILKRKLGPLTPEQERGLRVASKNIDRLIEMIDNLLSFSRLEKGETQLRLETIPLWQLVDEAIEMVGERMKRKSVSLTTHYESDDLIVRGDRIKIVQVMTNLLTNAVKFNNDGGEVRLAARRGPKGFVEVDVTDTGIGISPEEQQRIFERFYQVDASSSRRYEGTGIGLSIVRDILRLHGCSIGVSSQSGRGSVFTFTLPLARAEEPSRVRPATGRGQTTE
jgi:PAS domain S-box-containing protein